MITDRRRFGNGGMAALVAQVRAAAAAGVQLVQLRERDLDGRELFDLAVRVVAAVAGTSTRVVINDRLDVALAAGAHGVHLRASSFPPARVRRLAPPGFLIGQSVHSAAAATACTQGADYLLFGNVFETTSKMGKPAAGLVQLAAVVRSTPLPVLAVGGVALERVPQILAAGAAGVAGISFFHDGAVPRIDGT